MRRYTTRACVAAAAGVALTTVRVTGASASGAAQRALGGAWVPAAGTVQSRLGRQRCSRARAAEPSRSTSSVTVLSQDRDSGAQIYDSASPVLLTVYSRHKIGGLRCSVS
jgi:hypothetical protein